jgi:hypothetical protein
MVAFTTLAVCDGLQFVKQVCGSLALNGCFAWMTIGTSLSGPKEGGGDKRDEKVKIGHM